jgi:hypothetical protein
VHEKNATAIAAAGEERAMKMKSVEVTQEISAYDDLAEKIWRDLKERPPLAHVVQVTNEVAAEYGGATVTAYLPIILYRMAKKRLIAESRDEVVRDSMKL